MTPNGCIVKNDMTLYIYGENCPRNEPCIRTLILVRDNSQTVYVFFFSLIGKPPRKQKHSWLRQLEICSWRNERGGSVVVPDAVAVSKQRRTDICTMV